MTRSQILILALVLLAAVTARICSLPSQPFFCDVPRSVAAIDNGKMVIQFPGYASFHLVDKTLGSLLGGTFAGMVAFSLLCGIGAIIYCMLFAYDRAGFPGALLAGAFMGFSPIAIYFSCVGASYSTDLLGMSAVIYHGNRFLTKESEIDLKYAVLWFAFGCLMRSLSFTFLGFGILYLLRMSPGRRNLIFAATVAVLAGLFYLTVTFLYFGTFKDLLHSTGSPKAAGLHGVSWIWMAGNEIRNVLFLAWSMNVFAFVILAFLLLQRRQLNTKLSVFFALLTLPYFCFLIWYDCHAGYVCLLLPALICAPWLAERGAWFESMAPVFAIVFVILSFLQFFVARPIPFTGAVSLALNSYILTYTRAGIKEGMFANLKHWATQYHLEDQNPATDSPY